MGAEFGPAFAQTYGLIQGVRQRREELAQRAQEANLRGKLIDMQLEKTGRELQSGDLMRQLLSQTESVPRAGTALDVEANPEASGTEPPTQPRTPTLREMATAISGSEPEKAAGMLWQQQMLEQGQRQFGNVVDKLTSGGGAPGAPSTPATAMPVSAGRAEGSPATSTGAPGAGIKWTLNFDKTGNGSLSIANNPDQFTTTHQVMNTPNGLGQIWEISTNTRTGQTVRYPIGAPMPPELLQKAAAVAEGLGAPRASALHAVVTPRVAVALSLAPTEQSQALATIESDIQGALSGKTQLSAAPGSTEPAFEKSPRGGTPATSGTGLVRGAQKASEEKTIRMAREEAEARTVPSAQETQVAADAQTWVKQARDAAKMLEDYTKNMSNFQRLSFAKRVQLQGSHAIGAIPLTSEKEREITSAIGNLQLSWERASGGLRMASSPGMQDRIRMIFGDPTNAATPTHLRTIASMMETEIKQRAQTEKQGGRPVIATPPAGKPTRFRYDDKTGRLIPVP